MTRNLSASAEAYQLELRFNSDLVPQLLATFSLPDSPVNQYKVLCDDGTGRVRTGAPTFSVVALYYDTWDRKQSLPMRVDTLMTEDHVKPNPNSHLWVGKCVEDWSRTAYTCLVHMHMATAVTHPTLQILEMHSTAPHSANGHFYYHTFSAAAAIKLRTCKYVHIKVPGEY
ncbi:hypothetical protein WJX77_001690 [Trebouxia sp. C0004]